MRAASRVMYSGIIRSAQNHRLERARFRPLIPDAVAMQHRERRLGGHEENQQHDDTKIRGAPYSDRSALAGSLRVASRAANQQAAIATALSTAIAIPRAAGWTSNRILPGRRLSAMAAPSTA